MGAERDTDERNRFFQRIYHENLWQSAESVSGEGSAVWVCQPLIEQLPILLGKYEIGSMLDIPCGDFNWMSYVPFPKGFHYIGADVVPELIEETQKRHGNGGREFCVLDLVNDELPPVDLLFVRDLFIHLSLAVCRKAIENIARANFKYAMFTHDPISVRYPPTGNIEIERAQGGANFEFRPVSMMLAPFGFPASIDHITEHLDHSPGWHGQKQVALWTKEQIVGAVLPERET